LHDFVGRFNDAYRLGIEAPVLSFQPLTPDPGTPYPWLRSQLFNPCRACW
jgi:hypothetical protein